MRKFGLTFAVVAALSVGALGAGTTAAPVLAASHTASSVAGSAGASTSSRGTKKKAAKKRAAKKKAAKKKALRRCNSKRLKKRRKACRRAVRQRFASKPAKPDPPITPTAPVATIDVRDDYYSPDVVTIRSGESILWVWNDLNHDPHEVNLIDGPPGVKRDEFRTASAPAAQFTFTRTFTVPGTYHFACSLHVDMRMTVEVE